jgi:hypothetical protein
MLWQKMPPDADSVVGTESVEVRVLVTGLA